MERMDSFKRHFKHVQQISVWHCATFCEHGQLKGWQPHFQPMEALRKLLLPGSGCLEFLKGMAGMDFWSKHVELKSPFGSASHFANSAAARAWQPHFQPTAANCSISIIVCGLQQSHSTTESTITALQQILETATPWPNPLLFCIGQVFPAAATKGWDLLQP